LKDDQYGKCLRC